MKYHYFVSYVFVRNNQLTFGHCAVHRDKKINTTKEIEDVAKGIAEHNQIEGMVSIVSFIKIKGMKGE